MHRLEAAFYAARSERLINLERLRPAFQCDGTEVAIIELSLGETARARAEQHSARLSYLLQARGEVRRLTNSLLLRQCLLNQKFGNNHRARRNADADLHRLGDVPDTRYCINECERGAHSPLGIILMCLRKAEIDQRTVAHVAGNLSAIVTYDFCDAAVIHANQRSHVLRVQPRRSRGASQVTKHHCEVAPLAFARSPRFGPCFRSFRPV